jgi:predicted acylesterase/phospholipase RssA
MQRVRKKTLTMPISGAKIGAEIAGCILLVRCGYCPDLILASSGGCITAMMLIEAGIGNVRCRASRQAFEERLMHLTRQFSTQNYCRPWLPWSILNSIYSIGAGSLFNHGSGADFIDPSTVDMTNQPELWIGTTECATKKCQLFCTKSRDTACLQFTEGIYLNEDVETILDVAVASSAIQTIVPGVKIGDKYYQDGGHSRASPLGPFIDNHQEHNIVYHVVYISPVRYNKNDDPHTGELEDDDIWNRLRAGTGKLLTDWHVPDRNRGIQMVFQAAATRPDTMVWKQKGVGVRALAECLRRQERTYASFIEIAPLEACFVPFLHMEKGEVAKVVTQALETDFSVRHWYVK